MKSVNVKEARLFEQWANTTLAGTKWGEILQFEKDKEIIMKAWDELGKSKLYKKIGGEIEKKANEIVNTKCVPEWNRISEEMKPLGERVNELEKEKAAVPEDGTWETAKEEELKELHKKMSDLSDEYQKVTDEANKELNEYKDKRINEEQGGCFFLEDDEYDIVGGYAGWILPKVNEE